MWLTCGPQVDELHRLQGETVTKAHAMLRRRVQRWVFRKRVKDMIRNSGGLQKALEQLRTVDSVVQEIFTFEQKYVEDLRVLLFVYLEPVEVE